MSVGRLLAVGLALVSLALGSTAAQLTGHAAAQGTAPKPGSAPPGKVPAERGRGYAAADGSSKCRRTPNP